MSVSMSLATARRRSTVHDFSTFRLHRDGTRVPISSPVHAGLHDSRTRNTGRDIRGNRVARDAAGLGVVSKRKVMHEDDGDEMQNTKPRVPRRSKRRRIDDGDVEFLGRSGSGAARRTGGTTDEVMNWPVPSSDLLKCVHHFASQYYAARGLLSDRSRKYRREMRQRKAGVVAQVADSGTAREARENAGEDEDDLSAEGEEDSESDSGGEDPRYDGGVNKDEGKSSPSEGVPDMYKAFDGSALMAIGMLLQEHISTLLKPNVPQGWEEEMEAAGFVPEDESIVLDNDKVNDTESDKSDDEPIPDPRKGNTVFSCLAIKVATAGSPSATIGRPVEVSGIR